MSAPAPEVARLDGVHRRYRRGEALNADQEMTAWYGGGAEGYCDMD